MIKSGATLGERFGKALGGWTAAAPDRAALRRAMAPAKEGARAFALVVGFAALGLMAVSATMSAPPPRSGNDVRAFLNGTPATGAQTIIVNQALRPGVDIAGPAIPTGERARRSLAAAVSHFAALRITEAEARGGALETGSLRADAQHFPGDASPAP